MGVIALVAAAGYGASKIWHRIQSKRKDAATSDEGVRSDACSTTSVDEHEALIEEVEGLIAEITGMESRTEASDGYADLDEDEGDASARSPRRRAYLRR